MSDIWHRIATGLNAEVDSALWHLRESDAFKAMGSEIERALAAQFVMVMRIGAQPYYLGGGPITEHGFFLQPQFEVGNYRVDFAFGMTRDTAARKCIAIECDGHQWHEKTKEQAARDKARDRFLMIKGWPVLRFTGSEIHRDAAACAESVVDALHTQWHSGGGRVEDLQRIFDA
jgi:very-short-patch-repair endonuclease